MALAIAFEDAKKNQISIEADKERGAGGILNTTFFGSLTERKYELPLACLSQGDAGRSSTTHFHVVDQFQFVIAGDGTLGRHKLAPYMLHFSRAYTPYGPLKAGENGLSYFVLRAHHDTGAQRLPQQRAQLSQIPDREPWQLTRAIDFPDLSTDGNSDKVRTKAVPDMQDERGLAAYTISMKSHARVYASDPKQGDGQYLVVVKGSLQHNAREYRAPTLVFIGRQENPFEVRAGAEGLAALVVNFPRRIRASAPIPTPVADVRFKNWQCALCSFSYEEAQGLPDEGIAPGTLWQDVPETWTCPDCSANKSDFHMKEG